MIKSLSIKNFQSHAESFLSFSPGVNIIFGMSGNGKTAICRALEWAVTNRPSGGRFFSNFAGKKGITKVQLEVDDAPLISLEKKIHVKDKEKIVDSSVYKIGMEEYKGVGKGVPDIVKEALNISEINTQGQLDIPFLITSPPGEVGRVINRITKLEEADKWISKLTSKINNANKEAEIFKVDLKRKKEQLKEYDILPAMEVRITEVSKIYNDWIVGREREERLGYFIEQLVVVDKEIVKIQQELEVEKKIVQAEKIQQNLIQVKKEQENIAALLDTEVKILESKNFLLVQEKIKTTENLFYAFQEKRGEKRRLESFLNDLESCSEDIEEKEDFLQIEDSVEQLIQKEKKIGVIEKQQETLIRLIQRMEEVTENLFSSTIEYDRLKKEYRKELKRIRICPFCFAEVNEEKVEEIVERTRNN